MVGVDWARGRAPDGLAAGAIANALIASERRFLALVEVSLQGKLVHREFKPLFANRAFALLCGCDAAKDITERPDVLYFLDEESRTGPARAWERARRGPVCGRRMFRRRDGAVYPAEIYSRPIEWDGVDAVALAVLDVSEEENAQGALSDAQVVAEAAAMAKRRFLSAAGKELRGPIDALRERLQTLRTHSHDPYTELLAHEALESCINLSRRVEWALDAAAERGAAAPKACEPFWLRDAIEGALNDVRATADFAGVRLAELSDAPEGRVLGDANATRRLAAALLEAGVRRLPLGAVALAAQVEAAGVVISARAEGGLRPAPPGAHEDGDSPFDPLAAARRLAAAQAGVLVEWAQSPHIWSASAFLPLRRIDVDQPAPIARAFDVLVAEDGETTRTLLKVALESLGHRPHMAASGADALAAVKARDFDVVLMDIAMPDMSGLEVARAIRTLGGPAARAPIAALTGACQREMREQLAEAGMDAFLCMPLDIPRLAETLSLLAGGRSIDATLGDQIHHADDEQKSNNDAGRTQGH